MAKKKKYVRQKFLIEGQPYDLRFKDETLQHFFCEAVHTNVQRMNPVEFWDGRKLAVRPSAVSIIYPVET